MAVSRGSSCAADLPQALWGWELPCSLMAAAAAFKKELNVQWKAAWGKSPQHVHLAKIDDKMPSHSFIMATDELTRAQASMLMQLRMRHIPLNQFLHQIGKIDSLLCLACASVEETIHHYIFDCP